MKRLLTLNFLFFLIFSAILLTLGYSLHRLKSSFTHDILHRYSEQIHSNTIQLRLDLQTLVNDTNNHNIKLVPTLLNRYINIHPLTKQIQVYLEGKLVADSSLDHDADKIHRLQCLPIGQLSVATIENGIYCYTITLRVYRNGHRIPAKLYILLDRDRLTTELQRQLKRMLLPVYLVMGLVLLVSAILIWTAILRNFRRLIHWSDDPTRSPPKFLIHEFHLISRKMHLFATRLVEQFEHLREAMGRESYLRSIMKTVAKINELLVSERDENRFLQKACDILASHRNYHATTILLKDEKGEITPSSTILALDEETDRISSLCIPREVLDAFDDPGRTHLVEPAEEFMQETERCLPIQLMVDASDTWIAIFPLRYDTHHPPLGYLVINSAEKEGFDDEEIEMLQELAGDIGFATHAFRKEKEFDELLFRHPLSGLPNAASFHSGIQNHLNSIVAMANIDRFKQINTLYGAQFADEILKQFADYLRHIVPPPVKIFHYMGDEFLLLFDRTCEKNEVERILKELLRKVEEHVFIQEGVEVMLSIRFGVTILETPLSLRECHIALREAKAKQQPIRWYTPDMHLMFKQDMIQTYGILKNALQEKRVVNHYQGIYSLEAREFTHYEALVRIRKVDGELLAPAAFIDFAKQTRLYPRLSLEVFRQALEANEKLRRSVSVNLSAIDILNDDFRHALYSALDSVNLSHPMVFEILESENIENYDMTAEFIQKVKEYGCKVAIDDFGSGYANFRHIAELDVDILKIDGSLIKHLVHDPQIRAIVHNINQIAHDLGITTVAEFVASDEILHICKEIGIDAVQGYALHKPEDLETILTNS